MINFLIPTEKNGYKPAILSNSSVMFFTILILIGKILLSTLPSTVYASDINIDNVLYLTNKYREEQNLPTLVLDDSLSAAAYAKANDMIENQYWAHFSPTGKTPWDFMEDAGYWYIYAGENLGKGFKTAEGLVNAWIASPSHRDNLVNRNFREIGLAVVPGQLNNENILLVVQMFGAREGSQSEQNGGNQETSPSSSSSSGAISIDNPKNFSRLNNHEIIINGKTAEYSDAKVSVFIDKVFFGNASIKDGVWTYRTVVNKDSTYLMEAKLMRGETSFGEDSVTVSVDTVAPEVVNNYMRVYKDKGKYLLEVIVSEENVVGALLTKSESIPMNSGVGNRLTVDITNVDSNSNKLVLTDRAGNITKVQLDDKYFSRDDVSYSVFAGYISSDLYTLISSNLSEAVLVVSIILGFILVFNLGISLYRRKGHKFISANSYSILWILGLVISVIIGFQGGIV